MSAFDNEWDWLHEPEPDPFLDPAQEFHNFLYKSLAGDICKAEDERFFEVVRKAQQARRERVGKLYNHLYKGCDDG